MGQRDDPGAGHQETAKLLAALEQILTIEAVALADVLAGVADVLAGVLGAEKVDAFLHDPRQDLLVAVGASDTPLAQLERALGLDRLPTAQAGRVGWTFRTGRSYLTGRADLDPEHHPGIVHRLGVRSLMTAPFAAGQARRGVLAIASTAPDHFAAADLRFLDAIARWVALAAQRAELAERAVAETARREREAALAGLEAAIEQMPSGVALAEAPSGRLLLHNAEAVRLLRHPMLASADYRGYARYGALHADGTPYAPREYPIARAVRGETVRQHRMRYRRGDGTEAVFEVNAAPIRGADDRVTAAVSVFYDVSERERSLEREREARARAEEAVRQRDSFAAAVVHDLRTPLAALLAGAQLAHQRAERLAVPEARRIAEGLGRVEATAWRMGEMLADLLDLTRIEAGRPPPLHRRPTDLVALVGREVDEAARLTTRHRLRLEAQVPSLVGDWDAERLERVVANLLSNAVKFSPAGGAVDITVDREEQGGQAWAVLRVRDEGVGIPAADQASIFEGYHRARNVEGRIPGTGVGLTGSRFTVEQHGGSLDVESREGHGSVFTVRLPLGPP